MKENKCREEILAWPAVSRTAAGSLRIARQLRTVQCHKCHRTSSLVLGVHPRRRWDLDHLLCHCRRPFCRSCGMFTGGLTIVISRTVERMGGEPTTDEWEEEALGHLHKYGPGLVSTASIAHHCEEHRQDMDFCCLSCMAFICDACRGTEHRSHRVLHVEDATLHLHAELENAVGGPVSERIHEYASAARLVRARRSEIENQAIELEALIQKDFEAVVRAANERRRELLKVLHTTAAAKQGELCRQEMELTAMAEGLRVTAEGALSAATHILHSATAYAGDISATEPLPSDAACAQTCSAVGAVHEIVRLKREVLFASSQGLDWWCGPVEDADLCLDLTSRDEDLALIKSRGWVGESRSYEREGEEGGLVAGVQDGESVGNGMVKCWSGRAKQRSGRSRSTKASSLAMLYSAATKLLRCSSSREKPKNLARGI